MGLSLLAVLLVLPLLVLLLRCRQLKPSTSKSNPPPGPSPLPIIGNLHQLGALPHRSFHRLSKLHGPIFGLRLGRTPVVVVSSPSLAEQVLKTHDLDFCSRPPLVAFQELSFNGCDVAAAAYGDSWRHLRKIFILELLSSKKLRSYVPAREEETEKMMESMRAIAGGEGRRVVNITEHMMRLTNNLICRVAFSLGDDREGGYKERSRFIEILMEAQALMASFFVEDLFPGMGWVDVLTGNRRRLKKNSRELGEFYQRVIDQHLKARESEERGGEEKEDIVDVMLRLWKEGDQKNITMDHIKGTLMNIFVAGTDTSAATVIWAMAELARNPKVMRKAQDSVRTTMGMGERVEESDLPRLQYIKHVVTETLRLHAPVPLLVPRETIRPSTLDGYDIAAKTRVFVNVWAIGRDEEVWVRAGEFDPDRFMGSSVDYGGQDFKFLPFGSGRRMCPGINMGVATTELALANLLYAFDWELPPGMEEGDVDMDEARGVLTHKKTDLCLVATRRY